MYSWPATHTQNRASTLHPKGSTKSKEKVPDYPVLDVGTLAAATLVEENGRLQWTHIINTVSKGGTASARLKTGKSVMVFPATRPPPLRMPSMSITQRAEQGANFLRAHVPDIDIASELIREQLTEDARLLRQLEEFDPYVGNQLEPIVVQSGSNQSAFLAFPMGDLSRDLNISPLVFSESGGASFRPSAQAMRAFDTPIQQISASKPKAGPTYLAVRTFGATSLFEVTSQPQPQTHVNVKELGSDITSSDAGAKQVVDVKVSASPPDMIMTLANTQGAVYKYDARANKTRIVRPAHPPSPPSDVFWRVELTGSADTCLLMSSVDLKELDFRTPDSSSLPIYTALPSPSSTSEILTSVEDHAADADHLLRLCTTSQIVWVDRRFAAKPLLAFRHGRAFDRSLEARTISFENGHLTTLTSRKNGLLAVYDVARSQGHLASVQAPPYCLVTSTASTSTTSTFSSTSGNGGIQTQLGHCFLRHPLERPDSPLTFFRLADVGSISAFQLSLENTDAAAHADAEGVGVAREVGEASFEWSPDVRRLAAQAAHLKEEESTLGAREPTVFDMGPAYEHFFLTHRPRREHELEVDEAEALYDLVEKAPSFWQDLNEPVEKVLTSYDILLRSGDDPHTSTRADFLAESVVNSTRGFRAVAQGRVSAAALGKGAGWGYDLADTLGKFDQDLASPMNTDIRAIAERLRRFDLKGDGEGGERGMSSLRRESEAREQLALDLTLARHIYSPHPFSNSEREKGGDGDMKGELETMTKTLSLEDEEEPPPMVWGYLRPRRVRRRDTHAGDEDGDEDEEQEVEEEHEGKQKDVVPAGVRLLLKDWDVGADPRAFVYRDPYSGDSDGPVPVHTPSRSQRRKSYTANALLKDGNAHSQTQTQVPSQSQRAPPVLASTAPPVVTHNHFRFMSQDPSFGFGSGMAGSQPVAGNTTRGLGEMSQDVVMASTQVLPGAYGGRPVVGKKKVVKKRLGGF
ncbi:hypothetical protein K438DRAFT_1709725 [Mycena galopus ATCC 62051]|nr:hypothetical protein K438DRAFT_1709725 [Mycena galopus ATCC 62051]